MDCKDLVPAQSRSFEDLKQVNTYGAEYWSARDLQPLLGYNHWRSFKNAIQKAITSCQQSGNAPDHHFAGASKPIPGVSCLGSTYSTHHFARVRKPILLSKAKQNLRGVKESFCARPQNDIWAKNKWCGR